MKVALFDLDHTLIEGDSDVLWMRRIAAQGRADAAPLEGFFRDYAAGTLDIGAYYAYTMAVFAGCRLLDFGAELDAHFEETVKPLLRPAVLERLADERATGAVLALVTATGEVVARRVAEFLGFDALIATRHARQTGRFDGHMAGLPIFREGKIDGVEAWLRGRGASLATLADSSFYSDSRNDRFLMERVRRPVAVGPDEELRALSMERGWEILEIR